MFTKAWIDKDRSCVVDSSLSPKIFVSGSARTVTTELISNEEVSSVKLYTGDGREIDFAKGSNNRWTASLSFLNTGTYISTLAITLDSGEVITEQYNLNVRASREAYATLNSFAPNSLEIGDNAITLNISANRAIASVEVAPDTGEPEVNFTLSGGNYTGTINYSGAGSFTAVVKVTLSTSEEFTFNQAVTVSVSQADYNTFFIVADSANLTAADQAVKTYLESISHNVTAATASPTMTEPSGNDLIIISSTVVSSNVPAALKASPSGILMWERQLYDEFGLVPSASAHNVTQTSTITAEAGINLAGVSGDQDVYPPADPKGITYATQVGAKAIIAARVEFSGNNYPAIFGYNAGDNLADSTTAAGKRVAFFLSDTGFASITAEGKTLFKNAVEWALDLRQDTSPTVATLNSVSATAEDEITLSFASAVSEAQLTDIEITGTWARSMGDTISAQNTGFGTSTIKLKLKEPLHKWEEVKVSSNTLGFLNQSVLGVSSLSTPDSLLPFWPQDLWAGYSEGIEFGLGSSRVNRIQTLNGDKNSTPTNSLEAHLNDDGGHSVIIFDESGVIKDTDTVPPGTGKTIDVLPRTTGLSAPLTSTKYLSGISAPGIVGTQRITFNIRTTIAIDHIDFAYGVEQDGTVQGPDVITIIAASDERIGHISFRNCSFAFGVDETLNALSKATNQIEKVSFYRCHFRGTMKNAGHEEGSHPYHLLAYTNHGNANTDTYFTLSLIQCAFMDFEQRAPFTRGVNLYMANNVIGPSSGRYEQIGNENPLKAHLIAEGNYFYAGNLTDGSPSLEPFDVRGDINQYPNELDRVTLWLKDNRKNGNLPSVQSNIVSGSGKSHVRILESGDYPFTPPRYNPYPSSETLNLVKANVGPRPWSRHSTIQEQINRMGTNTQVAIAEPNAQGFAPEIAYTPASGAFTLPSDAWVKNPHWNNLQLALFAKERGLMSGT